MIQERRLRTKVRSIEQQLAEIARQRSVLMQEWERLEEERLDALRELDRYDEAEAFSDRLAG